MGTPRMFLHPPSATREPQLALPRIQQPLSATSRGALLGGTRCPPLQRTHSTRTHAHTSAADFLDSSADFFDCVAASSDFFALALAFFACSDPPPPPPPELAPPPPELAPEEDVLDVLVLPLPLPQPFEDEEQEAAPPAEEAVFGLFCFACAWL